MHVCLPPCPPPYAAGLALGGTAAALPAGRLRGAESAGTHPVTLGHSGPRAHLHRYAYRPAYAAPHLHTYAHADTTHPYSYAYPHSYAHAPTHFTRVFSERESVEAAGAVGLPRV